jgi:prepilin-type N-terminal cleavage/methylation domain-containing protein
MTPPASRRRLGFTLIELLVVIAIIVVLAAAGFSAGIVAMNHAKKLSSVATARALENAVNNFYTEYGSLPDVPYKVKTDSGEGVRLLNVLLGFEETSSKIQNTRMIKLLSAVETKTRSKGLLYNANGRAAEGLYDAWGSPFTVELDIQYEERLRVTLGSKTVMLNGRRVAVYSPGADKKLGTTDDVKTW